MPGSAEVEPPKGAASPDSPEPIGLAPKLLLLALVTSAFAVFAWARARHVGGCDSWSYLSQSMWMRGAGLDMTGPVDPTRFRAMVPLCHALVDGEVQSFFPPGYPALLAIAGVAGLEFFVNPLLGALSVLLLFLVLVRRTGPWIALIMSALWASAPLLVWGSVRVMSDLPAAVFLMASLLALTRQRPSASGALFGLSLGVRPTNALFGLAMAPRLLRERRVSLPFVFGAVAGASIWGVYLVAVYGVPWDAPYVRTNGPEMRLHADYGSQVWFLLHTTALLQPAVVLLALVPLFRRARGALSLGAVFLVFVLFYGVWSVRYETWWMTRFIFTSTAALYMLAGLGLRELRDKKLGAVFLRSRPAWLVLVALLAALVGLRGRNALRFGLLDLTHERGYELDSRRVAELTPPDSIVAALNYTGPLRLYGERGSFMWDHPGAPALIEDAFDHARPVYAVIEPDALPGLSNSEAWRTYELVEVARLRHWAGLRLHRVWPRVSQRRRRTTVSVRPVSSVGVSGDPRRLVDGFTPPEGSDGRSEHAVVFEDTDASVTLATSGLAARAVRVLADGDDTYLIEGSTTNSDFVPIARVEPGWQPGLRIREVRLAPDAPTAFLRVRPLGGDGLYSIAEIVLMRAGGRARVVDSRGVDLRDSFRAVDRVVPRPGAPWDGDGSIVLRPGASITLALPARPVTAVRVSADGNDTYRLEGSLDGRRFFPLTEVPMVHRPGMRVRAVPLSRSWSYLRISPGDGDGSYSIGEVTPVVAWQRSPVDLTRATSADGWTLEPDETGHVQLRFAQPRAQIHSIALDAGVMHRLAVTFDGEPIPAGTTVTLSFNDHELERQRIGPARRTVFPVVPGTWVQQQNTLTLEVDAGPQASHDRVAIDAVSFERARRRGE